MNKKKVIVCTVLFAVVVIGSIISTAFIRSDNGFSLYYILTSCITSLWVIECINKFYKWLIKTED